MPTFIQIELDQIAFWLDTESVKIAQLQQFLGVLQVDYDKVQLEHNIYQKMKDEALAVQATELAAKKLALETANPDPDGDSTINLRTIVYQPAHPNGGGADPTAWRITYQDLTNPLLPVTVIEYSHAIAWDNNAVILAAEQQWSIFNNWQIDDWYGTNHRLDGLDGAIQGTILEIAAIQARNAELREENL